MFPVKTAGQRTMILNKVFVGPFFSRIGHMITPVFHFTPAIGIFVIHSIKHHRCRIVMFFYVGKIYPVRFPVLVSGSNKIDL
jgi:hypothetical protein